MVGFWHDSPIEEDLNQQTSELKNSYDPLPLDLSVSELEDFSTSFLDFDSIRDWIEENPVLDMDGSKPAPESVDSVKMEDRPVEGCVGVDKVGSSRETSFGDGFQKLGNLGSSIEEEIGKVSLEGVLDCSVVANENDVKSGEMISLDDGVLKSGENLGINESCGKSGEIVATGGNGLKSDGNDSDSNSASDSASSSSCSSSSSSEEEEEGDDEDEAKREEGTEKQGKEGDVVKSGEMISLDDGGFKSGENLGINESCGKSGEIVATGGNGLKNDGNDSGSNSALDSASSSSSSSSSSEEEEEDDDEDEAEEEEEEEEVGTEKQGNEGELEEVEIDMEEGEIRNSDVELEQMVAWSDDEDDGGDGTVTGGPIRSKNEVKVLPPVPPVNVTLQPDHQTLPVGVILSIIGTQVIVEGVERHNPLSEGSILWITESRSPLGLVDEIFGPVKSPYYIVRYNSENEVPAGVKHGTSISFVPEFSNHVLNDSNLYKKGYDASGENDEELSDKAEFSDDEKEAEYKRMLKMTKRGTNEPKLGNKRKDRKKFRNRSGTWQNGQLPTPQTLQQPQNIQNQLCTPPLVVTSVDHGNSAQSSTGQGFAGSSPGLFPPSLPQMIQTSCFIPTSSGVWTTGMAHEQQQSLVFPNGLPTNGMPWLQQNHQQQSYQMPLPNRMPFHQQQFVPIQGLHSNVVMPVGQSNFCAGPGFAPWPGSLGQNSFNRQPLGMGLQCQQTTMSMNVGEQQPPLVPTSVEVTPTFNPGMSHGHGGRPNYRGGGLFGGRRGGRGRGRFGGGRGWQQSK